MSVLRLVAPVQKRQGGSKADNWGQCKLRQDFLALRVWDDRPDAEEEDRNCGNAEGMKRPAIECGQHTHQARHDALEDEDRPVLCGTDKCLHEEEGNTNACHCFGQSIEEWCLMSTTEREGHPRQAQNDPGAKLHRAHVSTQPQLTGLCPDHLRHLLGPFIAR